MVDLVRLHQQLTSKEEQIKNLNTLFEQSKMDGNKQLNSLKEQLLIKEKIETQIETPIISD